MRPTFSRRKACPPAALHRIWWARFAALAAVLLLAACGGTPRDVVARVRASLITRDSVEHWASVLRLKSVGETTRPGVHQAWQQQALEHLLRAYWLLGEAADRGTRVSDAEIADGLTQQRQASLTSQEFADELKSMGESVADARFEIATEIAASKLRAMLAHAAPKLSQAEGASYYHAHSARFGRKEIRYFDIVEGFPSAAEARRRMRIVALRRSFGMNVLHEMLQAPGEVPVVSSKRAIVKAIFAARPNTLEGPVMLNGLYAFFQVTRIMPGGLQPLSQVRSSIEASLASRVRQRARASFLEGWRSKWTAKTSCQAGFVVQGCRQFLGPSLPEADPLGGR